MQTSKVSPTVQVESRDARRSSRASSVVAADDERSG